MFQKKTNVKLPSVRLKKVKNPLSESFRQSLIIKFLCEIPNSRLIRLYNCPPFSSKEGRFVRRSTSLTPDGLPDLLFISEKHGVHFFEVKSESAFKTVMRRMEHFRKTIMIKDSNKHIKNQIRLIDEFNRYGVVKASFVSTVDHVRKALEESGDVHQVCCQGQQAS